MRRGSVRLHLGCGLVHRPGWVNLDRATGDAADLLGDAALLPFPDGCAEAIEARQLIEHLGYTGTLYALYEWARVLLPGGTLLMETPDRPSTLQAAATGEQDLALWPAAKLAPWPAARLAPWPAAKLAPWSAARLAPWLFGTEQRYLTHRYLFAGDELERLVTQAGFEDVRVEVVTTHPARPVLRLAARRAADELGIQFGARVHRAFVTTGVLDPLDVPPYMAALETICEQAVELICSLPPGADVLMQLVSLSARYSPRVSGCILRSLPDPAAWPAAKRAPWPIPELAQAIELAAALESERLPARLACRWRQLPKLPAATSAAWARLEREASLYLTARFFPHQGLDEVREDFEASTAELSSPDLWVDFFCCEALTDVARRLSAQGVRAFGRGDLAGGRSAFEAALDYDPDLFWPRWNLARLTLRQGRRLDALALYEGVQANLPAGLGRAFEQEMDAVCGRGESIEQFAVPLPDPAMLHLTID
jgi:hypothetical protein